MLLDSAITQSNMTFQEAYKLPLSYDGGFIVFTADGRRAFDFANNYIFDCPVIMGKSEMMDIVRMINGEYDGLEEVEIGDNMFIAYNSKDATITLDGKEFIIIRGWGHLTGSGGLRLSEEQAVKIQDDFAEFIIKQLEK